MSIKTKIERQFREKQFIKITREDSFFYQYSYGYIVDYSDKFIVLQESDDFRLLGYNVLPIKTFTKIRNNNKDQYYDKIMGWENQKENLGIKTKINLSSWKTIFETFQQNEMNIVVECENLFSFTIGLVIKVTDTSVQIRHFNAEGFLDAEPTKIKFKNITKVIFDDRYASIFSKYLKEREEKQCN